MQVVTLGRNSLVPTTGISPTHPSASSLMDSFDDSSDAGSAGPDAADVGDFVVGFLTASDFDPV